MLLILYLCLVTEVSTEEYVSLLPEEGAALRTLVPKMSRRDFHPFGFDKTNKTCGYG